MFEIDAHDAVCGGQGVAVNGAAGQSAAKGKRDHPLQRLRNLATLRMFPDLVPRAAGARGAAELGGADDRLSSERDS